MKFLCLEFINSRWYLTHQPFHDPLRNQDWFPLFCRQWGLPEETITEKEMEQLVSFREFLFQILWGYCMENTISVSGTERLNQILKTCQTHQALRPHNGGYALQTVYHTDNLTFIIYQIALSFAEMISGYPRENLKKCENPNCDWIFYDDSKSHTRKWCDNRCSSHQKVREHQESKKEQTCVKAAVTK